MEIMREKKEGVQRSEKNRTHNSVDAHRKTVCVCDQPLLLFSPPKDRDEDSDRVPD